MQFSVIFRPVELPNNSENCFCFESSVFKKNLLCPHVAVAQITELSNLRRYFYFKLWIISFTFVLGYKYNLIGSLSRRRVLLLLFVDVLIKIHFQYPIGAFLISK